MLFRSTHGAFKIDSALQLLAKPSMMSGPDPDPSPVLEASLEMRAALGSLANLYFPLWRALAGDDLHAARQSAQALESGTHQFQGLPGDATSTAFFGRMLASLSGHASALAQAEDIAGARVVFEHVSNSLIRAVRSVGLPDGFGVYLAYCPMTFEGRRADWLQDNRALLNPYFGATMLRCGDFDEISQPPAPTRIPPGHQH